MKKSILFVMVLLLGTAGMVQAQQGYGRYGRGNDDQGFRQMRGMTANLELTQDQEKQLDDLSLERQKEMLGLRTSLRAKRDELKLLLTADQANKSKISKNIEETQKIRTQMEEKRVDHLLKVRSLLTDDQKKQFDAMILDGRNHHRGFRGPETGKRMQRHRF